MSAPDRNARRAPLTASALLQGARGFSCVFWGIPVSLLFMVGAIQLDALVPIRLPSYFFGVLVLYVGFFFLYRAAPLRASWSRWSIMGLALSFAMIYFTPFFYWWRQSPFTPFFIFNMMGLLAVCAWMLYAVNQLSAEAGRLLDDPVLCTEARMCSWVSLLILVPILALAIGFVVRSAAWPDATWIVEYIQRHRQPPVWIFLCFLLPVALTMTSVWKAKERCLFALLQTNESSP